LLLQLHDIADRLVLDAGELGCGERVALPRLARLAQPLRAQQAADMVGAEGRRGSFGQGTPRLFTQSGKSAPARAEREGAMPPAAPFYCVAGCISCQGS